MISLQIEVLRHGATIVTESHVIGRRHELVALTNKAIAKHSLSHRARRQANLVLIWQTLAKRKTWQCRRVEVTLEDLKAPICSLPESEDAG